MFHQTRNISVPSVPPPRHFVPSPVPFPSELARKELIAPSQPHPANVATATAWTQQQLVFESTPLSEAADAFNRFNARQLRIEGAVLADFHVSGTFPARDPTSLSRFVLFLRAQPGIEVQESDDEISVRPK